MPDVHGPAVLVAAVVAFLLSGGYYALLGDRLARLSPAYAEGGRPTPATIGVELLRNLVMASVVAGLASGLGLGGLAGGVLLGLALWLAFPVVLLAGSVFHERVPPLLAAMHSGDWLLKLVVVTGLVTVWPH